jgi:hypothetical protein
MVPNQTICRLFRSAFGIIEMFVLGHKRTSNAAKVDVLLGVKQTYSGEKRTFQFLMSALRGKADALARLSECPLIAISGHLCSHGLDALGTDFGF